MKLIVCAAGVAALYLTWAAPAGAQPVADHLKCYKVRDPQARTSYTADLEGLVAEPGCRISVPAKTACVPATKTNVTPAPPGGGGTGTPNPFLCYKVKCPKVTPPTVALTDQFGSRTVTPSKASLVCAPAMSPTLPSALSFPATGQTTCFDNSGTVIPCAGTGQDGDIKAGAALAYTDNGDGTITDNNTGLMWEKQCQDGSIHDLSNIYCGWDAAFSAHVAALNTMSFAGHADWRLPDIRELASIIDYEVPPPGPTVAGVFNTACTAGCTTTNCSCTQPGRYWSSTSGTENPARARTVLFYRGDVDTDAKTGNCDYVRAVRGSS
jgi:type 1 fimbria pilin